MDRLQLLIMAPSQSRQRSLQNALANDSAIDLAGVASTFPMLRSLMAEVSADVVLAEIRARADRAIARDWLLDLIEVVPVLVLDSDLDSTVLNRMIRQQAGGALQSDAHPKQILQALKSVSSGLLVFDPSLIPDRAPVRRTEELTPRESQVLSLLAEGLGNKEIGATLDISEHTIKFHIRSILAKLGASSRTEAVTRGLRGGLIEL
jgi:NarL family two-component system response regulator YdfI